MGAAERHLVSASLAMVAISGTPERRARVQVARPSKEMAQSGGQQRREETTHLDYRSHFQARLLAAAAGHRTVRAPSSWTVQSAAAVAAAAGQRRRQVVFADFACAAALPIAGCCCPIGSRHRDHRKYGAAAVGRF